MYKYQEEFVAQLITEWMNGDNTGVRTKIRNLKNKAQAAYIAAAIAQQLDDAEEFVTFMHPNNQ